MSFDPCSEPLLPAQITMLGTVEELRDDCDMLPALKELMA